MYVCWKMAGMLRPHEQACLEFHFCCSLLQNRHLAHASLLRRRNACNADLGCRAALESGHRSGTVTGCTRLYLATQPTARRWSRQRAIKIIGNLLALKVDSCGVSACCIWCECLLHMTTYWWVSVQGLCFMCCERWVPVVLVQCVRAHGVVLTSPALRRHQLTQWCSPRARLPQPQRCCYV